MDKVAQSIKRFLFDISSPEAQKGIATVQAFKKNIVKPAVETPVGKVVNAFLPVLDPKTNTLFPNSVVRKPADPMNLAFMTGTVGPKSIAKVIDFKKLKLDDDFQRAIGDVLQGKKAVSKLPPHVLPNPDGTFGIADGNHRIAEMMLKGGDKAEMILDPKAYRKLAELEEKSLSQQATQAKEAFSRYLKKSDGKFAGSKSVEYIYHATQSKENLPSIVKEGLRATDNRPVFFAPDMESMMTWVGKNNPNPEPIIRVPKNQVSVTVKKDGILGTLISNKSVPATNFEVSFDGGKTWKAIEKAIKSKK